MPTTNGASWQPDQGIPNEGHHGGYLAVPVSGTPGQEPVDLTPLLARLDALETRATHLESLHVEVNKQLGSINELIRRLSERPRSGRATLIKAYLLSVPERVVRATLGLGAGVAREVGEVALPDGVRRSQLYQNLVDTTLRFLIEQVGGAEGVYRAKGTLPRQLPRQAHRRQRRRSCLASSRFVRRRSGSSPRSRTSAAWVGT